MKRKYRQYSDKQVSKAVEKSRSIAQVLEYLELKKAGGNYANIKSLIQRLNLNCDHWTGQAWNKNERLKDWSDYSRAVRLKPHLIRERGHRCEFCNLTEWMGHKIPLEVHHKDGDRTNNELPNLELRCGNCHALTPNWRNRQNKIR